MVRECHPQKIQCMLGALQSAFREPAFLHKGGDALSKMYLTTFTTFHWSFSHKLHTPSMISSRSSSIIHPVSSSTETRKTPPKPRRHRLIPFHCTHTHHCSQTCRPLPSAIAFATFSQLGAAARQFPSTFAFKNLTLVVQQALLLDWERQSTVSHPWRNHADSACAIGEVGVGIFESGFRFLGVTVFDPSGQARLESSSFRFQLLTWLSFLLTERTVTRPFASNGLRKLLTTSGCCEFPWMLGLKFDPAGFEQFFFFFFSIERVLLFSAVKRSSRLWLRIGWS